MNTIALDNTDNIENTSANKASEGMTMSGGSLDAAYDLFAKTNVSKFMTFV